MFDVNFCLQTFPHASEVLLSVPNHFALVHVGPASINQAFCARADMAMLVLSPIRP